MNEEKQLTNTSHLVLFKICCLTAPNLQETQSLTFWDSILKMSSPQFPSGNTNLVNPYGSQNWWIWGPKPRTHDHWIIDRHFGQADFFRSSKGWKKLMLFGKLWNQNPTETACVDENVWENTDHHFLISDVPSLYNLYQVQKITETTEAPNKTKQNKTKPSSITVITFFFFTSHPIIQVIQVLSPPTTWQTVERRISFAYDIPSVPLMTSLLRSDRDSPNHQEWRPWDPKFGVQLQGGGATTELGGAPMMFVSLINIYIYYTFIYV